MAGEAKAATMNTVELIREKGIGAVVSLGIKAREYPDRLILNYDQIASEKHHPVVRECRGLVLSLPDLRVLCRPMDRFFNVREDPRWAEFPFDRCVIEEKVDGSMLAAYHDGDKWCVSTRGMAMAEGTTAFGLSFRDIFWSVAPILPDELIGCTVVFEMVSPETRVVKPYPKRDLTLLTVRDNATGGEWSCRAVDNVAEMIGVKRPTVYRITDGLGAIEAMVRALPSKFDEGVVLRTGEDRPWRLKLKAEAYLAIAHLRNNGVLTPWRIARMVIEDADAEYLLYFPEDAPHFEPYRAKLAELEAMAENMAPLFAIESQKEFAMAVKDTPIGSFMFTCRKKPCTLREWMKNATDGWCEQALAPKNTTAEARDGGE